MKRVLHSSSLLDYERGSSEEENKLEGETEADRWEDTWRECVWVKLITKGSEEKSCKLLTQNNFNIVENWKVPKEWTEAVVVDLT